MYIQYKDYIIRFITNYIIGDLATITFGHHALLASKRGGAILGTLLTIILAIIFTSLQGFEYVQSSVTIADSVFGSAFFCGTGLHGYVLPLSNKFGTLKNKKLINNINNMEKNNKNNTNNNSKNKFKNF